MAQFLKLVSKQGTPLQGWSKDPDWTGWIPVAAYSFGNNRATYSNSASAHPGVSKEVSLTVKLEDLDSASLYQWAVSGTVGTATLNNVPDAVGKGGQSWIFSDALISSVQHGGSFIVFSINFSEMEFRYLLRFR